MRILLVEDDAMTALFIKKGLMQAGFVVTHAHEGAEGLNIGSTESFDAAIIDIMLPKLDGLAVIKELRNKKVMTPIIVLSAKDSVDDRIKGLQAGGDDYLVKPFAFSELLARIHALIRRANYVAEPTTLTVADLSIDIVKYKVHRGGKEIRLQPREFALLKYLMRNAGLVVSRTMIMENVWEYNFDPQTNVVDVRICRLRDKIDRFSDRKLIHSLRGVGYVLEDKK